MDDEFIFPAADLYRPVYDHAPPNDPSKSILSLPTEVIVNIAQLNYKTAIALMCTNRVLHAAGITALYARVYLKGWMFKRFNPDAPNFIVPGVLGSLLAKREHTAALRYLKILSMPYDTNHWTEFSTLIYRVFERAHGLVHVDLRAIYGFQHAPSPGHNSLQQIYPQNLHTLHLRSPTDHFAPPLLTAPSLKEVQISGSLWRWDTFPERKQGAYSQLTSWSYDDQEVEVDTPVDDFLKMVTPFGSVERLEVKVDQLSEFFDCVPQWGARVKHLSLIFVWQGLDVEWPPIGERVKHLLLQGLNTVCPALGLDMSEVRTIRGYAVWAGARGGPT